MKIRNLVVIALVVIFTNALAQNHYESWSWARGYGVPDNENMHEEVTGVAYDTQGNLFVAGVHYNTFDMGTYTLENATGGWAIFLAKYSPEGSLLWAQTFGGDVPNSDEVKRITTDKNDNVYLSGAFGSDSLDFGNNVILYQTGEAYVAKFNNDGVAQWARGVQSSEMPEYSYAKGIAAGSDGLFVLYDFEGESITVGDTTFYNQSDYTTRLDGMFVKFDFDGNFLWGRHFYGASDEFLFDIACNEHNEVAIAGKFKGENSLMQFGPGVTLLHANNYDQELFVAKYDAEGNALWARTADYEDNSASESCESVAVDNCGNVYATGDFTAQTISFDGFTATNDAFGNNVDENLYWVKFNPDGQTEWLGALGNGKATHTGAIVLDHTQSPIVYGGVHSDGTVLLGDSLYNTGGPVYYMAYVGRIDKNTGQLGWSTIVTDFEGSMEFWYSDIADLAIDSEGNIATACNYFTYNTGVWNGADFTMGDNTIVGLGGKDFAVGVIPITQAYANESNMIDFSLTEQVDLAEIDNQAFTVTIEVEEGTDISNLNPDITLSEGAWICESYTDFTNPVVYTVYSEDGSTQQEWTVTVTIATKVANYEEENLTVFPNPSKGKYTVKMSDTKQIIVTDLLGKEIQPMVIKLSDESLLIDLSKYKTGIYNLKIVSENKSYSIKLIKQ